MNGFSDVVKKFFEEGKVVQSEFAECLIKDKGGEIREATESEDMFKHIDLFWNPHMKGKRECSFDVKGMKKVNRLDESKTNTSTWLELQNVNGQKGSLLGDADYISFESNEGWYIANRKKLLFKLMESLITYDVEIKPPNIKPVYFKKYQRQGRKDIIVLVPMSFIIENSQVMIPKLNK